MGDKSRVVSWHHFAANYAKACVAGGIDPSGDPLSKAVISVTRMMDVLEQNLAVRVDELADRIERLEAGHAQP